MVPDGWQTSMLAEIASVSSGGTPRRSNPNFWGGSIPWVTTGEIQGNVITDTYEKITESGLQNSSAKLFPKRTILLAMYGQGKTRGKVAMLGIEASSNQACAAIIPRADISSDFLYQNLLSRYEEIRNLSNDGSQKNLSGELVKAIRIMYPPIAEQRRIAKILSTWDRAIETVGRLIEINRRQNNALMQMLLRPSGSSVSEWHQYRLDEIAEVQISNVDKKSVPGQAPVRLCNYMDVYHNDYVTSELDFMSATATAAQIAKFSLKRGDILITKDSETPDDIAVPAMVDDDLDGVVCGYHVAVIRPKGTVDSLFLRSLFALNATQHYFFTRANGATRFGLTIDAINSAIFLLPTLLEQRKAARIIRSAEEVTDRFEAVLSRLRAEKAALMQQLLTGKRRVRVDQKDAKAATG